MKFLFLLLLFLNTFCENFIINEVYLHLHAGCFSKIPEREGSISPASFHGQLRGYQSHVFALSTKWKNQSYLCFMSPFHFITLPPFPPRHLTTLPLFPPSHLISLPPTNKALQNNNIKPSVSPHIFLTEGPQYQSFKASSYSPSRETVSDRCV